nr:EamA family transporter [Pararoseomonas indoligenes]
MAVAFAGLVLIGTTVGGNGVTALGLGLCLGSAACWAMGNVLLRGAGRTGDALALMSWMALVPILPLLAMSLALEGPGTVAHALTHLRWGGVAGVLYVAVAATSIGYGIWGFLMARYPATTVAPFALLVPITGAASAALVVGESFGTARLAGMALVLAGLGIGVLRWRRDPAPASG